jgi:hypothetical protein
MHRQRLQIPTRRYILPVNEKLRLHCDEDQGPLKKIYSVDISMSEKTEDMMIYLFHFFLSG